MRRSLPRGLYYRLNAPSTAAAARSPRGYPELVAHFDIYNEQDRYGPISIHEPWLPCSNTRARQRSRIAKLRRAGRRYGPPATNHTDSPHQQNNRPYAAGDRRKRSRFQFLAEELVHLPAMMPPKAPTSSRIAPQSNGDRTSPPRMRRRKSKPPAVLVSTAIHFTKSQTIRPRRRAPAAK
jgi:hypothetical protein